MPESAAQPTRPANPPAAAGAEKAQRCERHFYAWCAARLGLLGLLGAFCWFLLWPILSARSLARARASGRISYRQELQAIEAHGGARRVAAGTALYLRMPEWLMQDKKEQRYPAIDILSRCGAEGIPALIHLLADPVYGDVAQSATWGLNFKLDSEDHAALARCLPELVALLEHELSRDCAARLIWQIGPEACPALPALRNALERGARDFYLGVAAWDLSTDFRTRLAALKCVLSHDWSEDHPYSPEARDPCGDWQYGMLLPSWADPERDRPARFNDVISLLASDNCTASDYLTALADPSPCVREFFCTRLPPDLRKDPALVRALTKALDDPDGHVRIAAARHLILADIQAERAVVTLVAATHDERDHGRRCPLTADASSMLVRILRDVPEALKHVPDPEGAKALEKVIKGECSDYDEQLRKDAAYLLETIRRRARGK